MMRRRSPPKRGAIRKSNGGSTLPQPPPARGGGLRYDSPSPCGRGPGGGDMAAPSKILRDKRIHRRPSARARRDKPRRDDLAVVDPKRWLGVQPQLENPDVVAPVVPPLGRLVHQAQGAGRPASPISSDNSLIAAAAGVSPRFTPPPGKHSVLRYDCRTTSTRSPTQMATSTPSWRGRRRNHQLRAATKPRR